MTSSTSPIFEMLPLETQLLILERLDGASLLAARHSCRLWRNLSDKAIETFFKEVCGGEKYVQNGGVELSLSDLGRLNIRIALAAKNAWEKALTPIQYKKLRPLFAHEMGQPRPSCPVNVCLMGANAPLLFSDEGCRLQKSPLILKKEAPLTIELANGGVALKEFPMEEFGVVRDAFQAEKGIYLLTRKDASMHFLLLDRSTLTPSSQIDLKIEDAVAFCLAEGRVIVSAASGDVYDYRLREDGSLILVKSVWYPQPVKWVRPFAGEGMACLSEGTLYVNQPGKDIVEYPLQDEEGLPELLNGGIVFLKRNGDLVFLNAPCPPTPSVVRANVSSWVSLGESAVLVTTLEGTLELMSSSQQLLSAGFPEKDLLLAACRREGLIAAAFSSGEVVVFEERGNALVRIYSTDCFKDKAPVHALLFSKTLELTITTRDGGIFSIRPFPNETVAEKEPDSLFEAIKRLFSFVK